MKKYTATATKYLLIAFAGILLLASCRKEAGDKAKASQTPQAVKLDPGSGSGNDVLTLTGTGLGEIRSIVFSRQNVPASFNPVFNTDGALLFRVPDTAYGGAQEIVFTNKLGVVFKVPFNVIALPIISSASTTDFEAGTVITLLGNNLDDVSAVSLDGTADAATIISQTRRSLVIRMPASAVLRAKLRVKNASGEIVTPQVFINIDQAFPIFKDAWNPLVENWSWSMNLATNTANKVTGTASLDASYTGAWGGMQMHLTTALDITPYKEVAFWIKGAAGTTKKIRFYLNWNNMQTLDVPADVWTYYRFDLQPFKNAGVINFDTWVMQVEGDPVTFYMDNLVFLK